MESEVVIRAENVSKQYRLGVIDTHTFAQDVSRWWHRKWGKEDPYHKINIEKSGENKNGADYLWALKDINFEVRHGEVFGIIGKNGAGKSTLLKILSRITQPTSGEIYIKGRIGSLLEVGTGFHPDLTGRENVFMNGTILGMKNAEIKNKFDEIVDFSGVEKFIDTPVKRYSSGMYVRLAFSVAAHLEPEILIIDEVLAVGDAEFQKKCLAKMKDVAGHGRTVLFVSHNMNAISRLCTKAILLLKGTISESGEAIDVVNQYLKYNFTETRQKTECAPVNEKGKDIELTRVKITHLNGETILKPISVNDSFQINIHYKFNTSVINPNLTFHLKNSNDEFIILSDIKDSNGFLPSDPGEYEFNIRIDQPLLKPDLYHLFIGITNMTTGATNHFPSILNFEIVDILGVRGSRVGYIYKNLEWKLMN